MSARIASQLRSEIAAARAAITNSYLELWDEHPESRGTAEPGDDQRQTPEPPSADPTPGLAEHDPIATGPRVTDGAPARAQAGSVPTANGEIESCRASAKRM
jgi:hypothetical protein